MLAMVGGFLGAWKVSSVPRCYMIPFRPALPCRAVYGRLIDHTSTLLVLHGRIESSSTLKPPKDLTDDNGLIEVPVSTGALYSVCYLLSRGFSTKSITFHSDNYAVYTYVAYERWPTGP